ncbi:low temperature requirement protein A [Streptomyces sp. NPDC059785]|uniref:low temperature requirement protein A n=1 Tax=Streptomyces sp. NPDC059785 TaxID=3346945 RepID=UPI003649AC84
MADTPTNILMPSTAPERHASWLELFFDLVAVAGVAQLAHLLHGEPGWRDVGLYIVLFLAFWTNWLVLTLYGNVAGENTRVRTLLAGMFGLTVMAAAVHGVQEGEKGTAFAIAYTATRFLGGSVFRDRRELLLDWPTVSFGAGTVPWIVSIWVDGPARPWLWTAGVALDLYVTFVLSKGRLLRHFEEQRERVRRREAALSETGRSREVRETGRSREDGGQVTIARTDTEHLAERLGLFTIIVLGEGVIQLVEAGSGIEWSHHFFYVMPAAFLLLVLLWSLSLRRGRGGIPGLGDDTPQPRLLLGLHCFVTGALAALAAAVGVAVEHADGRLPEQTGWLMAAALGAYLLVATALTHWTRSVGRARLLTAALPALALCAALGLTDGADRRPVVAVWVLVAALVWFARWTRQTPGRELDLTDGIETSPLPRT